MNQQTSITVGQCSNKGGKPINQDFHALANPRESLLGSKGIALALADGISSSDVSRQASETTVAAFVNEYYDTPEPWSVKTSVFRVLQATNSWLYSQTRNGPFRYQLDRGYVCTFSGIVFKADSAHLFHAGDSRIYRIAGGNMEQLTEDHRLWPSPDKSYLARAMGMRDWLDLDYRQLPLEVDDLFILATDGVYEFISEASILNTIEEHADDLDQAAASIVEQALSSGSDDNLTVQIARVEHVEQHAIGEVSQLADALEFPPQLRPRMEFDGFEIIREIHSSSRSHVYLARDIESQAEVILKLPSVDMRNDKGYLERFMMEGWVARRVDNPHVIKGFDGQRKQQYLYLASEYIEGRTLSQWIKDNPQPDLEAVRNIVEQIAKGLQALHRQEMLHQDLRPENIMIDQSGTVKIIDLGSVRIAGIAEINAGIDNQQILGTFQYAAPEYFLGEIGSPASDQFSLGVIVYHMLSAELPYGPRIARATTRAAQRKLVYQTVLDDERTIPGWVDYAIRKAVQISPEKRYDSIFEFVHDLRNPNAAFLSQYQAPLMERNPLAFWKGVSLGLLLLVIYLLATHPGINP